MSLIAIFPLFLSPTIHPSKISISKMVSTTPNVIKKLKPSIQAPFLSFLTEDNYRFQTISDGTNNNSITEMTLTVYTSLGITIPKQGETVNFSLSPELLGKVILSSNTGSTDATGRCYITIKAAAIGPIPAGKVYSKWKPSWDPNTEIEDNVTITFQSFPTNQTPPPLSYALKNPSNPCIFSDDSPSYMSTFVFFSRISLSIPTKISFSNISLSLPQIYWSPESLDDGLPTWGSNLVYSLFPTIIFNEFHINHNPMVNGKLGAPPEHRHNLQYLANHELGHALGLGHNWGNVGSLMWPDVNGYFFTGIETPRDCDISVLNWYYPQL